MIMAQSTGLKLVIVNVCLLATAVKDLQSPDYCNRV
jgi:hypothetical protein